jgi:hypothetical protein
MKCVNGHFFLLLSILIVAGCDQSNDPTPTTPTQCFVQKESYSDGGFSRELTFIYNSNDQVIKIIGTTSTGFSGEGTYVYDSNGNIIRLEGSINSPGGPIAYTYNEKNLLTRLERFTSSGDLDYKFEYGYNSFDQRINEMYYYSMQDILVEGRTKLFEYKTSTSKDPSIEKEFDETGSLYKTREYEYDDKKNSAPHFSAIGLPQQNITKETAKDASGNVLYVETIVYEYNELGYPIKSVSNLKTNKTPGVTTRTYAYDCR